MIGGLMKTTSRFAMAAAAGLFMGAVAFTPAKAADLGGDCCADLEERVAELEATTARKGNRVVSLQFYGQVNKALLIWDDGFDSDGYVVDNDYSGSRLGFRGTGSIKPGWTAGYLFEFDIQTAASNSVDQGGDDFSTLTTRGAAGDTGEIFKQRKIEAYIESAQLGRVTIGQGDAASNGIAEITLGGATSGSDILYNSFFELREDEDGFGLGLRWSDVTSNLDGVSRRNRIRYDTPSIYGFIASASWGEDDYYDFALRFSKEWNSIRVAAGIAYAHQDFQNNSGIFLGNDEFEILSGSLSVMHMPSGLYATFAAGTQDVEDEFGDPGKGDDAHYYYTQLGITRNFTGVGATTFYVEYGYYEDFGVNDGYTAAQGIFNVPYILADSEVNRYGIGFNQNFASAALDIYVDIQYFEADVNLQTEEDEFFGLESDWFGAVIGTRIRF